MIIREQEGQRIVILQEDHAHQAATFASAWGTAPYDVPAPRDAIILATRLHDLGWHEWDANPTLAPDGTPYGLLTVPIAEHLHLYRRGVDGVAGRDPYAALLVSLHATGLYRERHGTQPGMGRKELTAREQQATERFIHEEEARQQHLRNQLAADPRYAEWSDESAIWHSYKLLQVFDRLSLYCLLRPPVPLTLSPVPTRLNKPEEPLELRPPDSCTVVITPYPFQHDPLEVPVPVRLVRSGAFHSALEWRNAIDTAPVESWRFTFCSEQSRVIT